MVRIKSLSIISKVIIALLAFIGIILQTGLYEGRFNVAVFRMYTNISNLVCGIYFILCALVIATDKTRDGGASPLPFFKGICTMSITLTGVVAAAVIESDLTLDRPQGIATLLLHVATPVLIMADWLVFDTKGRWHKASPLFWLASPCLYFIYIMITAAFMDKGTKLRFPYPFLDYELLGIPLLLGVVVIISIFYVGIGYLCYAIDLKMGRLETGKLPLKRQDKSPLS